MLPEMVDGLSLEEDPWTNKAPWDTGDNCVMYHCGYHPPLYPPFPPPHYTHIVSNCCSFIIP